jgi:anthranilate/para-aminobenzoate synthase component I
MLDDPKERAEHVMLVDLARTTTKAESADWERFGSGVYADSPVQPCKTIVSQVVG